MNVTTPEPFDARLQRDGMRLVRDVLSTVQVNVGKVCNQSCRHCHVDASPFRTESMSRETADEVLAFLGRSGARVLDITGGAPELNPSFRHLVRGAVAQGVSVIDRCNLTILEEPGQEDLADFLAAHHVHVIASLPCYSAGNVDTQRGDGVYERSIRALERLNALGYGCGDPHLVLDLVYNPVGPSLPPAQAALQADYQRELDARHGIKFDHLLTITNLPIARFAGDLRRSGRLEAYEALLASSHNPDVVQGVMCRSLVSLGWDGRVYDCDFNQMLDMTLTEDVRPLHVSQLTRAHLVGRAILTGNHCYGCTAGTGSSCGGALA